MRLIDADVYADHLENELKKNINRVKQKTFTDFLIASAIIASVAADLRNEKITPTIDALPKVELLTDGEQSIFLSAMRREEKICKEFDDKIFSCDSASLVKVCHEITRKVKGALWTERRLEDGKE